MPVLLQYYFAFVFSLIIEFMWMISVRGVNTKKTGITVLIAVLMPLFGYLSTVIVVNNIMTLFPALAGHAIGAVAGMYFSNRME